MKYTAQILAAALLFAACQVQAHGDEANRPAHSFDASQVEQTPFGQQGDPKKVSRTIRVGMEDKMRFEPGNITVKKGTTVRFVVANKGAVLHEMVLGTPEALRDHAELMKKHPGMEHDEPSMTHVSPGRTGEIVWQFNKPGRFQFACLIPGHFEAGMVGDLTVE